MIVIEIITEIRVIAVFLAVLWLDDSFSLNRFSRINSCDSPAITDLYRGNDSLDSDSLLFLVVNESYESLNLDL